MSIENSPYISGLNDAIPANTSPRAEGAAQIRAIKTAVTNTFPNVDAPVTASASRMNEVFNNPSQVPIGLVAMWTEQNLPTGWVDCNGEIHKGYQTPDLRGMFVRGVDDKHPVTATGGNDSPAIEDQIKGQEHKLSIPELPAHKHEYVDRYFPEEEEYLKKKGASNIMPNDSGNAVGSSATDTNNDGLLFVEAETKATGSGLGHKHGLESNVDNPFDNRPAFYSIRFICYVGE